MTKTDVQMYMYLFISLFSFMCICLHTERPDPAKIVDVVADITSLISKKIHIWIDYRSM